MNHTTAWKLKHWTALGTFLCSKGYYDAQIFRYDSANIYFWDKSNKREVPMARADLLAVLAMPVEETALPYQGSNGNVRVGNRGK